MPRFFSKTKGRIKLAYRTPDWFRRAQKFVKPHRFPKMRPPKATKT